ncbi:MAG: hypothetical protein OES47_01680 [Acidobacteriota bacterium]|nr:hypothetical protein [Acidobacteriota bacterium]
MNRPSFESLDQAIESLEPQTASTGFSRRVMAALPAAYEPTRPEAQAGRRWALAALAAAVTIGILLGLEREPPLGGELAAETEAIRVQHAELVQELQTLRGMAQETTPVLYLGADGDLDLVLDLAALMEETALQPVAAQRQPGFRNAVNTIY